VEFTSKTVVAAVARELGMPEENLFVESLDDGKTDEDTLSVTSKTNEEFSVVVHKSRDIFEGGNLELIQEYLGDGIIDEVFDVESKPLLDAVAAVCCLDDLQPWLVSTCREEIYSGDMTIARMHDLLRDPFGSVQALVDKEDVYHVLVAQCRPTDENLAKAILEGIGGSEGFLKKKLVYTEEGFVIDSDNDYTANLVDDLVAKRLSDSKGTG